MTDRFRMLRTTAVAGATMTGLLLLAGCTGQTNHPDPGPTASTAPSESGSASGEPSPTVSAGDTDDPACLIGDWDVDEQSLTDFYAQVSAIAGEAGITFTPEGTAALTIGADDYTWTPDLTLKLDAAGTPMSVDISGSISGTYTATPGHIATDATVANDLEIVADAAGQAIDAAEIVEQIVQAPVGDATFACTPDTLELDTAVADGVATLTLTRR
ncbi:hypothetical protein [Microbacterium terricola]|uniref:Lipoprotein n=1 Tax=Microbacterium terricola TaxID=344163 RepID=A0ABM8E227_9MICO|nr:hypothetical protein [Microbacterium terricola]UYK40283.1 hypothetical protein OAU46_01125 [Microbacterium terricola]BDV32004.1 hypothetical protein Microterr_26640 [Microbacterium terricola]